MKRSRGENEPVRAEKKTIPTETRHTGIGAASADGDDRALGPEHTISVVRTDGDFDALEDRWNALIDGSDATVFQTYEWQRTWWTYFGGGAILEILLFEREGELDGIVPLCRLSVKLLGIPVATHLKFLGVGLSDYLSPIMLRGSESAVIGSLARHLAAHRNEWDVFDLEDVNEKSACTDLLPAALEREGLPVFYYQGSMCPAISLPGSMDELMKSMGSSTSYNLKRKFKRLKSHFTSDVELVRHESDDIAGAIDDFASIHGHRWKSQGHPSAFDDEKHRNFHADVCRRLARRDWLRIFFLRVEGRRVAVSFSFNFRSVIYMYQSNAYGPEDVMKCSPGLLIRSAAIEEGIGEGMRVFDFMRGDEEYKYREWNAINSKNWSIRTSPKTAGGRIRFFFFLWAELFNKARKRIQWEWYEYRRFRITGRAGTPRGKYLLDKTASLFGVFVDFMQRHFLRGKKPGGSA